MKNSVFTRIRTAEEGYKDYSYYAVFTLMKVKDGYEVSTYVADSIATIPEAIMNTGHRIEASEDVFSSLSSAAQYIKSFARNYEHACCSNTIAIFRPKEFSTSEVQQLMKDVPKHTVITPKQFEFIFNISVKKDYH